MTDPTLPSTEAVGEVRRRVEQVLGDLDVDAIERQWLARCAACDAGLPEYGCSHPDEDYRPTMLRLVGEVRRLRTLVGAVQLFGTGFQWRRSDGELFVLHPAEVDVFVAADHVAELQRLRTELEASALAAEKLFEQRDTAIDIAVELRTKAEQTIVERDTAIAEATKLRAELERWTSGQRRKGLPVVEAVPDGLQVAAGLARSIGTEGGEEHDALLSRAAQTLKNLHDAASYLIVERDTAIRERDEARNLYAETCDFADGYLTQLRAAEGERDAAMRNWVGVQDEYERALPVLEAATGLVEWWRRMDPDESPTHPMAPLAEAVDVYNATKEDQ